MSIISGLLGHVLRIIVEFVQNYGLSIILFTIFVKVILLPLTIKQTKSTKAMQDIQPKLCLPLLIQFPILIGLYNVLREPVQWGVFADQTAFANADMVFLWVKNLTQPDYILAIISGVTTFVMQTLMMPKDQQQGSMKIMTYVMSAMMLYWGFMFPAGLTLYWTVGNLFSIAQHYLIMNPLKAKLANSKEEVIDEKKPRTKK